MAFEDQINPAKGLQVFVWQCLTEIHRQAAMFVFSEQCGPADLSKKKGKQRQTEKKETEKQKPKKENRKEKH